MRALTVEDDADYAEMLLSALEPYMSADHAPNGTEGVKVFCNALRAEEPYQLVLVDLQMPMRDGVETIRTIRMIEQRLLLSGTLGAKIVVLTGYPDNFLAKRAITAGADAVLAKTAGVSAVIDKICEMGLLNDGPLTDRVTQRMHRESES